jgi:hypothetical protein
MGEVDVGARKKKNRLGRKVALMTRLRLQCLVLTREDLAVRSRRSESWSVFEVGAQIGR